MFESVEKAMNRPRMSLIAALILTTAFAAFTRPASAGSPPAGSWRNKVASDLLAKIDASPAGAQLVDVIIQANGPLSSSHTGAVAAMGGSLKKHLGVVNGVSVRLPLYVARVLSQLDAFAYIAPDRPVSMLGHLENTTGAAQARTLVPGISSLNGAGVGIAILDSGIYYNTHEITYSTSRITVQMDFGGFGNTTDYYGHGTHVASVACGTNHIKTGYYTGIAPGANIINCKVLDRTGTGYTSNIIDAINWCISNRAVYNIKVINMSLGAPAVDSYKNDPLCQAVRAAHDAGIVVVTAAGNDGKDQNGNKIYGAIHSPGIEPSAITVGACNTFGTDSRGDDGVSTYSSRGPTRGYYTNSSGQKVYDNLIKPDLVAPGNKIVAAEAVGCDMVYYHPELNADPTETNQYHYVMYMSGSSVAAPVVSGAAALLLQANPSLTPNLVKAILMYSAQPLAGFNTLEQGAGELNIDGAVRIAKIIKNPLPALANGQAMLSSALPAQSSTISGQTFPWSQAVITNWSFVYGSALMNNWQGMYGQSVLLADATYLSSGQLWENTSDVSSGVLLTDGIHKSDGTSLISGGLLYNGSAVLLADGTLLNDSVLLADASLLSDSTLLANGTLISDTIGYYCPGDSTTGMTPYSGSTGTQ
jgi:serine protease AprX